MKKLIAASLLVALGSAPMLSWAGSDSGLYIGASVGQSSVESDFDGSSFDIDDEDNGYKILFGYNFGLLPFLDLAIEADYRDYGTFGGNNASAELVSSEIFGVVGFNIGPLGVFGKVGYSDADFDAVVDDVDLNDSDSATAYGIGAKINLGSFGIRAEYEELDLDAVDDVNMFSIGATYTF